MPSNERSHRRQWAVLLPVTGVDRYGKPTVGSPVEIRVRWDTDQVESVDSQGNVISTPGYAIVNVTVPVGSRMWQGRLVDYQALSGDSLTNNLFEVISYKDCPDLKGRAALRTVQLMRLHNKV